VIATSKFKLPLLVAALWVAVCLAVLVLPLEVAEVGEGNLRAEPITGELVGIESIATPVGKGRDAMSDRARRNGT
jgi:hypothetical protein